MNEYQVDGLWVRTKRLFLILYREALFLGGENLSVEQFTKAYIKKLKRAKLSAFQKGENLITLPDTLSIWITTDDLTDTRKKVTEFIWLQDQVRLIYILKIQQIPVWGCVQIPNSQLEKLRAQRHSIDANLTLLRVWCGVHTSLMFRAQAQNRISIFRIVESAAFHGAEECVHAIKYTRWFFV